MSGFIFSIAISLKTALSEPFRIVWGLNENINRLQKEIKKSASKNRFHDIIKYKELILKNIELGYPLYIHSSCLNFLGAKIKNDGYYILDGSRRLSAHILAQNNPSILVINLNE